MKLNNWKLYVFLVALAVSAGLFFYFATREIPLPKNAVHRNGMYYITLGESVTDEQVRRQASFVVPDRYKVHVSENGIAFYILLPDGTPFIGTNSPPPNSVNVAIRYHAKANMSRSKYLIKDLQPKEGILNSMPWFVEHKWRMDIYQSRLQGEKESRAAKETIRTHFSFPGVDGDGLVVTDPGDWSWRYEIDRTLNSHVEIRYQVAKSQIRGGIHLVDDILAADKVVIDVVRSFQPQ